jgi:uncharacterized protein YycO
MRMRDVIAMHQAAPSFSQYTSTYLAVHRCIEREQAIKQSHTLIATHLLIWHCPLEGSASSFMQYTNTYLAVHWHYITVAYSYSDAPVNKPLPSGVHILSYSCMRPEATSALGLKATGLKLLVHTS